MPDRDRPDPPDRPEVLAARPTDAAARRDPDAELPVVARLVVEIRSDGTRTVARGAIEEAATGERVAIEARGSSPLQLATQLARSLWQLPRLALRTRGLLGRGKKR